MVLSQLQAKYTDIETKVKTWVAKQPPPVEVAVVAAASALQGGVIGGMMGTFTADMAGSMPDANSMAGMNPDAAAKMKQMQALTGGPWSQARNFAVMTGVNAGITAAMKRAKGGVEDLQTSATAAFGSGIAFSLVSGVGDAGGNPAVNALSTGMAFAVFQGAFFQLGKMFTGNTSAGEQAEYAETKEMLQALGLTKYEKHFKKGLLNDATLPLINDSALQEVKIPPGPRLRILDHIHRTKRSVGHRAASKHTVASAAAVSLPAGTIATLPSTSSDSSSSSGAMVPSF
eukprot:TRINITY_DN5979_c0_g1_i1.p1 TRINITY_DN5979_c0_g1~~TRINITY_DN5979_c0_g1_i1.p1  ORF type:complete len:287 (+),score=27.17 TRINITY_DN5979_c0_g1_i1:165-1025(+)